MKTKRQKPEVQTNTTHVEKDRLRKKQLRRQHRKKTNKQKKKDRSDIVR